MKIKSFLVAFLPLALLAMLAHAQAPPIAPAQPELKILITPAVQPACEELSPVYLAQRHTAIKIETGGSMGTTGTAIPARLDRGEVFDVVILFDASLDDLIRRGKVLPDSKVDLVNSDIGMAVKAGSPKPDIATLDALKKTLLAAKSITYTTGVSGVYVRDVMFPMLGIADEMKAKTVMSTSSGDTVVEGKAEIGFQQVSELMPVKGLDIQALPHAAAKPSVFSAGIPVNAPHPKEAREYIQWLASPAAYEAIRKAGLDPFHAK